MPETIDCILSLFFMFLGRFPSVSPVPATKGYHQCHGWAQSPRPPVTDPDLAE